MTDKEKLCFVISPIGEQNSDTRRRSDQVLHHIIRPAAEKCGYKAVRADEIDKPGIITSQVIQHVVNDDLVVADLTERNPNVFYELAIRHALRKPLVQIIQKGEAIPFDVAGTRTIHVDHTDLDSAETANNEIVKQIEALERDSSDMETPISVSLDLQLLRQSEKPEERSLGDLVAAVVDLRASMSKVELRLGTKDQQGLLGEIQTELNRLPARIDKYLADSRLPGMWHRRHHPGMFQELLHASSPDIPAFEILIVASLFHDSMPWLYEMGMEVYRAARRGDNNKLQIAAREFRQAVEFAAHSPLSQEFFGRNEKTFMIMEEIGWVLDRAISTLHLEGESGRR